MTFNFSSYSLIFFTLGTLVLILAIVIWTRRSSPGALSMVVCLTAISFWIFARTFMVSTPEIPDKVYLAKLMYCCTITGVLTWFSFTMDYTGSIWHRKYKIIIFLSILPFVYLITASFIHWPIFDILLVKPYVSGNLLLWKQGPAFWFLMSYIFIILLISFIRLIRFGLRTSRAQSSQVFILCSGTIIAVIALFFNSLGFLNSEKTDYLAYMIFVAGLFYVINLFKLKFLDINTQAYKALIQNIPYGVVILNSSDSIIDMNPAAEKKLKVEKKKVFGRRIDKTFPWMNLSETNLKTDQHFQVKCPDKENSQYLDIRLVIMSNGLKFKGKLLVMQDISERIKVEQTIRENELRYRTLVDQSTDGVLIIQDGKYIFINKAISQLSGYSTQEIIGQPVSNILFEESSGKIKMFENLDITGKKYLEILLKSKDGLLREVEASINVITFDGRSAFMMTLRDITERKLSQIKIKKLYNQEVKLRTNLENEIDKRNKYTRTLVHELKAPLMEVLDLSQYLETSFQDDTSRALITNIRRASYNFENRINELIELEKGETGKLKINLMPVDLTLLITQIYNDLNPMAVKKGLSIQTDLDPELSIIQGDWIRISQVMTNLLSNAIKYTSSGTITIIGKNIDSENVLVSIEDTGRGIDSEQMENLFDPYRRKAIGGMQFSGIGIGLALCKLYVELHKGKIWVNSVYGKGSTFSVSLPVNQ